jgi:hypothetical protein
MLLWMNTLPGWREDLHGLFYPAEMQMIQNQDVWAVHK